jgi:hypothetical protein
MIRIASPLVHWSLTESIDMPEPERLKYGYINKPLGV